MQRRFKNVTLLSALTGTALILGSQPPEAANTRHLCRNPYDKFPMADCKLPHTDLHHHDRHPHGGTYST